MRTTQARRWGTVIVGLVWAGLWAGLAAGEAKPKKPAKEAPAPSITLKEARAGFTTTLTREGPPPKVLPTPDTPPGAERVEYEAAPGKLMAWRSPDPGDGKRHPAVVFAHGGYALKLTAWEATQGFRDAGYVVLTPALRAENGNPGYFEGFWGEVDDLVAAGEHLAGLSYVDPERIYLAGHSVGGMLAMLGSMYPSRFQAVSASGGCPDTDLFFSFLPAYAPFDRADKEEMRLRSATALTAHIQVPLQLVYGDTETVYTKHARTLCAKAKKNKKICDLKVVKGNHTTSVPGTVKEAVKWFAKVEEKKAKEAEKKAKESAKTSDVVP